MIGDKISRLTGSIGLAMMLALILLAALGNGKIVRADTPEFSVTANAAGTPPVISVWYGNVQTFTLGTPQTWLNLLGSVSDVDNDILTGTVEYSLNGNSAVTLSLGPDNRRLLTAGDFNIELDVSTLNNGANTVVITATDAASNQSTQTVNFTYDSTMEWALPYSINWGSVGNVLDAVQPVDGDWSVSGAGIRTVDVGYDRIIAVGDVAWTDFEVTVPITVHSLDTSAYGNPFSVGPGLGLVMRWQGHTNNPINCTGSSGIHCGWKPQGGNPWYEWTQDGSGDEWRLGNNQFSSVDPLGRTMTLGVPYVWKLRGQTTISGTLYQFKVWQDGTAEPSGWQMSGVETPNANYLSNGSLLFVAHHVDATFGDITVAPVLSPTLTVGSVGPGAVSVNPTVTQPYSYTYGTVVTLTATPDPGMNFVGWSGDITGVLTETTVTMTADTVVTATFSAQVLNLTTATDGSGTLDVSPPGPYALNQTVTVTATPATGWTFSGWSGDLSGTANPESLIMSADKSITATFTAIQYTVTAQIQGNGSVQITPAGPYTFGQVVTLTATPQSGWLFQQWNGPVDSPLVATTTLTVQDNHVVTATFGLGQYSLTVTPVGTGAVSANPDLTTYTHGQTVTLTATPSPGNAFVRWEGDLAGTTNPDIITMTGNKSIQAIFTALISYTLSTAASGNGAVIASPQQTEYLSGTVVSLTAAPDVGWYFSGWSGDASGTTNPISLTMNANKTVQGNFIAQPAGTFASDDFDACGLNPVWTFSEGLPGDPAPVISEGQVLLTAPAGTDHDIWTNGVLVPRIMQSIANADFEIEGKFIATMTQKYQQHGIVVEASNGDVLRFEVYFDGTQNQFFAAIVTGGVPQVQHSVGIGASTPPYMRVKRVGNQWTHSYSMDGINWTQRNFTFATTVTQAGVYVGNSSDSGITAPLHTVSVEYVYNTTYPGVGDVRSPSPKTLTTAVTGSGSGNVAKNPDKTGYSCGELVTLTATPDVGSAFAGWSGAASGTTNPTTLTMDADKSLTATFTLNQYSLSTATDGTGSGNVSLNPPGGVYDYGTVVTVTATADTGSSFAGWSGAASGTTNPVTVTMNADKSLTATFTLNQYSLSTATDGTGSGSVSLNPPGGVYDYGAVVTVTATAATGSGFTGWSGAASGTTNPVTVTMNADKSLTATFTLGKHSISLQKAGSGSGSVSLNPPGGVYDYGTVVTVTATAATGSIFGGWSGAASGTTNPVTVTMNADKSLTATFNIDMPYDIFLPLVLKQ